MKLLIPFGFISLVFAISGCGSDAPKGPEKLSTTPVDGIVILNGKPAAEVSISLHHSEGKVAPRGMSDKDGKFSISTYGKDDGAPIGKYKVTAAKNMTKEISPVFSPHHLQEALNLISLPNTNRLIPRISRLKSRLAKRTHLRLILNKHLCKYWP